MRSPGLIGSCRFTRSVTDHSLLPLPLPCRPAAVQVATGLYRCFFFPFSRVTSSFSPWIHSGPISRPSHFPLFSAFSTKSLHCWTLKSTVDRSVNVGDPPWVLTKCRRTAGGPPSIGPGPPRIASYLPWIGGITLDLRWIRAGPRWIGAHPPPLPSCFSSPPRCPGPCAGAYSSSSSPSPAAAE